MKAALMSDSEVSPHVEVQITVDQVKNMAGKGQYVYVHVTKEKLPDGCEDVEPIIKFNDGHFGGGSNVFFHNPLVKEWQKTNDGPCEVGMYWTIVKPAIHKLLNK